LAERRRPQPRRPPDPAAWGIIPGFEDAGHIWRQSPQATVDAILSAMGATATGPAPPPVLTVRLDQPPPRLSPGRLILEDGATVDVHRSFPAGLPPGYHRLEPDEGPEVALIATPGRCPLPPEPGWGFAAQLYAARSRASWGSGDLADLTRLGWWSRGLGAAFVLVNPLHASSPTFPQQNSPYFPGSRCFLSPLYLAVEEVPGSAGRADVQRLATTGRALNAARLIDRDRVWGLKSEALEAIYRDFGGDPAFNAYLADRGDILQRFATFCALSELHGAAWRSWPSSFRDHASSAVREFTASPSGSWRVRYHAWLQWRLDQQLQMAAASLPVMSDLAVGVDPDGADAWMWPEAFVTEMRVGAPPDQYNTRGQDWALPPFDPWRLRAAGYEPWVESLRGALRHGGGLRLDHVMGLFRLYWIPVGASPGEGAYVRYPHHDLLNIVALEAQRAGAFVVGEDLGTVEPGVRQELGGRNLLSYKVWWFEEDEPPAWPAKALGTVTTHDLPTVAGVLTGSDLLVQRRLDLEPNEAAFADMQSKLLTRTRSEATTPVETVVQRVYADLARAPCLLLAASLDDMLTVEERPNLPATVDEWPNWRLALPRPLEELEALDLPAAVGADLSQRP
jgi:4-alpha-glucanotransferase